MAKLLPTTVVGSYPQPDWLVDRGPAARTACRASTRRRSGASPSRLLEQAQDDATILAIRDMERAGIDIVTDGEIRRESYSNRFAAGAGRHRRRQPGRGRSAAPARSTPVPRVVGKIRRRGPVEVRDVRVPARQHRRAPPRSPCPARSPWPSRRRTSSTTTRKRWRWTTPPPSTRRLRDLKAAGADVVQLDEPWLRHAPRRRARYGVRAHQPRAGGHRRRRPSCISASAMPRSCTTSRTRLLLPAAARRHHRAADLDRGGAAQARPRRAARPGRQDDHARRARPRQPRRSRPPRWSPSASARRCSYVAGRTPGAGAGLRHEIPAARRAPSAS